MKKKFISYFLILCTILLILSGCTKKEENNKQENQNTSNTEISKCCRNLKNYNTAGGFIWKYIPFQYQKVTQPQI